MLSIYLCFAVRQFHSSQCQTSGPSREMQWERLGETFSSSRIFHMAGEPGEKAKEKVAEVVNSKKK